MNKKIIQKKYLLFYTKRHPWSLMYDIANYLKIDLHGYILYFEQDTEKVYRFHGIRGHKLVITRKDWLALLKCDNRIIKELIHSRKEFHL